MSLRDLPQPPVFERPKNYAVEVPADIESRWTPVAAATDEEATITVFDVIGEDPWNGGGFTARRASAALRSIGARDVKVRINSPGGDMFEGIAIYNLLREHKHKVTVEVVGLAASAASIIAMAADDLVMGLGSFLMVHKAWGMVVGNEDDFRAAASVFAEFDGALSDIYEARTGVARAEIERMMRDETWMTASRAVDLGFADRVDSALALPEEAAPEARSDLMARRTVENALAKAGVTRSRRAELISNLTGAARDAGAPAGRDAGHDLSAAMVQLLNTIKG